MVDLGILKFVIAGFIAFVAVVYAITSFLKFGKSLFRLGISLFVILVSAIVILILLFFL